MDINFDLFRIFYVVANSKSISNAAKELYITQPAVSQSIKQLEKKLGGRLFFRTKKGIILTPEGEHIFKYIEQANNFIVSAQIKFTEMQNLQSGEIRIGASDTLCKYYLLPYLETFHNKYPHIRIQITNRTTPETISLLESGKVDLGIINLPIENKKYFNITKIMDIEECFISGEKYKQMSKISIKKLITYPILLLEKGSITRTQVDLFFNSYGYEVVPEIELGSIDLLVKFAKINLGISYVIKNFIKDELEKSSIFEVKLAEKIPQRQIGLITLNNVPLSSVSKKFIQLLV